MLIFLSNSIYSESDLNKEKPVNIRIFEFPLYLRAFPRRAGSGNRTRQKPFIHGLNLLSFQSALQFQFINVVIILFELRRRK